MSRAFLPLLNLSPASNYDAYLSSVVLLTHFDEWVNADDIVSAINTTGQAVKKSGTPTLSSAHVRFGGASLYCGASASDFAYAGNVHVGTGDFTWEGFCYLSSNASTQGLIAVGHNSSATNQLICVDASGVLRYTHNSVNKIVGTTTLSTGAWHHFAVSRASGSTRLFLDGTQEGATYSDSADYPSEVCWLASTNYPTSHRLYGYLDEVRITTGAGRYTANFTPSAVAFPAA
jgi:hypothetical protein